MSKLMACSVLEWTYPSRWWGLFGGDERNNGLNQLGRGVFPSTVPVEVKPRVFYLHLK